MSSIESQQVGKLLRIVVLGASSRLARLIRPFWHHDATTWASRSEAREDLRIDLLGPQPQISDVLRGADCVICLAGVVPGGDQPDFDANVTLARAALDGALRAGVGHVLLASSAAVYGAAPSPLHEAGPARPQSPYGQAKLAMEQMAAAHPQSNTCLRIGNVAGADAILGGWHAAMALDQLADGTSPRRSYIGPQTLARVLQGLAPQRGLPAVLNVAAPGAVEMGALLEAADLPFGYRAASLQTLADVTMDTGALQSFVDFTADDSDADQMVKQWRRATKKGQQ